MWRRCCPPSGAGDKKPIPRIEVVPLRRYEEPAASTDPEANRQLTARRLPQTRLRRASSLRSGAMGAYHFTLDFRNSMVPSVESLRQKSKIFASSLSQGSLGCSADTGRVREVTIRRKPPCALTAAARRNTSLREGGGLGRSPKTEGAIGRIANFKDRGGTSPEVSGFLYRWDESTR